MNVYLVRHWQTYENAAGVLQWHFDGKLNSIWIAQANHAAQSLSAIQLDSIYTSDLSRAYDTAIAIHTKQLLLPRLTSTSLLRERDLWPLTGKHKDSINNNYWIDSKTKLRAFFDNTVPWVENHQQIWVRAKEFIDTYLIWSSDDTVLVVSHNGLLKAIYWQMFPSLDQTTIQFDNAAISLVVREWEVWEESWRNMNIL